MELLSFISGVGMVGTSLGGILTFKKYYIHYSFKNQEPQQRLIDVINKTKKNLDIAIYALTDEKIVESILDANSRGVKIRILTDKEQTAKDYQTPFIQRLSNEGIPVKINTHEGKMHLKVTIADNSVVTTGSYNYTRSASTKNDEVLVIIPDEDIVNQWKREFDSMWQDEDNYQELLEFRSFT